MKRRDLLKKSTVGAIAVTLPLSAIPDEYPWAYIHKECGGVAFYCKRELMSGDLMSSSIAVLPNNEHPKMGDKFICPSCGKQLVPNPKDFDWFKV